jgi:hypothetical protein
VGVSVAWFGWIGVYAPVWLKALVATAVVVTAVATMATRRIQDDDQR